jgi:hypothetical protein
LGEVRDADQGGLVGQEAEDGTMLEFDSVPAGNEIVFD